MKKKKKPCKNTGNMPPRTLYDMYSNNVTSSPSHCPQNDFLSATRKTFSKHYFQVALYRKLRRKNVVPLRKICYAIAQKVPFVIFIFPKRHPSPFRPKLTTMMLSRARATTKKNTLSYTYERVNFRVHVTANYP